MTDNRSNTGLPILWVFSGLFFAFFLFIVYGNVFSRGVSHADDAYIATGAKNLALNYGYSTSLTPDGSYGLSYFSVGFTTGPVLSVPTALVIRLAGNKPWIPGFTVATINTILLLLIFMVMKSNRDTRRALVYFILLLFLLFVLTDQWWVGVGEVPAALFSLLGIIVLVYAPEKRVQVVWACLSFGLAFMSKMVSVLGFIPVVIWMIYRIYQQKADRKKAVVSFLLGLLTFVAPFIVFEIYKLSFLGPEGYIRNYREFFAILPVWHDVSSMRVTGGISSMLASLSSKAAGFRLFFGFSLVSFILAAGMAGMLVSRFNTDPGVRVLSRLMLAGTTLHFLWWFFLSSGKPRYMLIGLFLFFAVLSMIVFMNLPRIMGLLTVTVCLFVFVDGRKKLIAPVRLVIRHPFQYTPYVRNMLRTVEFLKLEESRRPFLYTWWASVADLEYSLRTVGNFKQIDHLEDADFHRELLLVRNSKWKNNTYETEYRKLESRFSEVVFDAPPFSVLRYHSDPVEVMLNDTIRFSLNGNSGAYVTFGWELPGRFSRSTSAARAGMEFKMVETPGHNLVIRLLGRSMPVQGPSGSRMVKVKFNDSLVACWQMEDERWYEARVPAGLVRGSTNQLILDHAASPDPADKYHPAGEGPAGIEVKAIVFSTVPDLPRSGRAPHEAVFP